MAVQGWSAALVAWIVAGAAVIAAGVAPARAADDPAVDSGPATIDARAISSSEPTYVFVRLKAGKEPLSDITLTTLSNDGIATSIEDGGSPNLAQLSAKGEHVWKLRLVPGKGAMLAPAAMSVQIDVAVKEGASKLPRHLFHAIKITAPSADAVPTLEFNPATVDGRIVSSAEPVHAQVRLKALTQDLSDISLSAFSNEAVTVTIVGEPSAARLSSLAANAEHAWTLRIEPKGAAFTSGAISVNVTAAFKQGRDEPRQRYAAQTLKITAPAAATIPALIDFEIKGSLQALSHERKGRLFVVVTNKHSQAVRVTDINLPEPPYIKFGKPEPDFKDERFSGVPYGEARVFSYEVIASDQVVPGKYPAIVTVSAGVPNGISGAVVKMQEVELTVLGESDLLSKIGAPSLLFLPGVLFLLAWQILWSFRKTAAERDEYKMTPTSGSFWVIAVVISLGFGAWIYPWAVQLVFRKKRDYLVAYGLMDFIYIFTLTLAAACAIYLLWLVLLWALAQIKAWIVYFNTPNETDLPLAILKKLGRLRGDTRFRQAHPAGGNAAHLALILEPWREPAFLWLTPPAVLRETDAATADALNFIQQLATGEITSASVLAKRLGEGLKNGWWTLGWEPVGNLRHPRKQPITGWTEVPAEDLLVRTPP